MPFYAVRNGRANGVYESWTECENQVKGFQGASFKKFNSMEEAQDFVNSRILANSSCNASGWGQKQSSELKNSSFCYAVRKGRQPGIYSTWTECQQQVTGFHGASFRKFKTREEAEEFVSSTGSCSNTSATSSFNTSALSNDSLHSGNAPRVVYTDGGCFSNGKKGASAGYGVWWGTKHPWNESRRLKGQQTNNRAEIEAAIAAVRCANREGLQHIEIRTDSQFLINCITCWIKKWRRNDWTLSDGKAVKVRGPIKRLDDLLIQTGIKVTWTHVAGHSGIKGNEEADKLAREGSNKPYVPIFDSDSDDEYY